MFISFFYRVTPFILPSPLCPLLVHAHRLLTHSPLPLSLKSTKMIDYFELNNTKLDILNQIVTQAKRQKIPQCCCYKLFKVKTRKALKLARQMDFCSAIETALRCIYVNLVLHLSHCHSEQGGRASCLDTD